MNSRKHFHALSFGVCLFILCSAFAFAQTETKAAKPGAQPAAAERDGQHDFDFELGSWKIHLKRRLDPLTGSVTDVQKQNFIAGPIAPYPVRR